MIVKSYPGMVIFLIFKESPQLTIRSVQIALILYMEKPITIACCIVIILFTLSDCTEVDPVTYGYYHIDNRTLNILIIEATSIHQAQIDLITDTVSPFSVVLFYKAIECSGGHVRPSNFFSTFRVSAIINGIDSLIYQGVNDKDWEFREEGQEGGQNYYLIVGP